MRSFFSHRLTRYSLIALIFLCTALAVVPSQWDVMQYFRDYAMHIMLAMLIVGMAFFILDQKQLMISSLIACATLCIFLKDASHQALFYPRANQTDLYRVCHINAASAERRYEDVLNMIEEHNPDFVTVQECTPDWFYFFGKALSGYPYEHRIELPISFGSVLYSKYELSPSDTIFINEIPNLISRVHLVDDKELTIVNTYLHTPQIVKESSDVNERLDQFTNYILDSPDSPMLHIGDFNLTYWSGSILDYRLESNLSNSRKGIDLSKMYVPYDHIFYSHHLECVNFYDLELNDGIHIGIIGDYLFKESQQKNKETFSSNLSRF